jgi:tryptophan 2,3-dioxygenase
MQDSDKIEAEQRLLALAEQFKRWRGQLNEAVETVTGRAMRAGSGIDSGADEFLRSETATFKFG